MGSITAQWSFGDGTDSIAQNIVKSFAAPGVYTVKLVAITDNNCKDSVTKQFTVHPEPRAGFRINDDEQCLTGNQFLFTDTSTINTETLGGRFWSFGNGDTSSAAEAAISYSHTGVFPVHMIATSQYGCADTLTRYISVNAGLSAGFTIDNDSQCLAGNRFQVSDTSDADNRRWYWDHIVGQSTEEATVSFLTAGVHTISLVSATATGCKDSVEQTVVVHPQPQAKSISGNSTVFVGQKSSYSVNSTAGSIYNWLAEGGVIDSGIGSAAIDLTWGNITGNGRIRVVETSMFGCVGDTGSLSIVINSIPDSLTTDKDTIYIPAGASTDSFRIYCTTNWVINPSASWLTVLPNGGSGDSTITLLATANIGTGRSATIEISAGDLSKNVVVMQAGLVGLDEFSGSDLRTIFPNPSSGIFTLRGIPDENVKAILFDCNGRMLDQRIMKSNMLDYCFLPDGIYMLELHSREGIHHSKLTIFR
jgi:PKD repeat protein